MSLLDLRPLRDHVLASVPLIPVATLCILSSDGFSISGRSNSSIELSQIIFALSNVTYPGAPEDKGFSSISFIEENSSTTPQPVVVVDFDTVSSIQSEKSTWDDERGITALKIYRLKSFPSTTKYYIFISLFRLTFTNFFNQLQPYCRFFQNIPISILVPLGLYNSHRLIPSESSVKIRIWSNQTLSL